MTSGLNNFEGGKLEKEFQTGAAKNMPPSRDEAIIFLDAIVHGDSATVAKYVERYGAGIIERSPHYGGTPLTLACSGTARGDENLAVVKLLLENGAKLEARDAVSLDANTPLMIAARNFQHEVVALLLERGADPAAKDRNGLNARQLLAERAYKDPNAVPQINQPDDQTLRLLDKALADRAALKVRPPAGPKQ